MGSNLHKKLLQREMDRKEFLHFSAGLLIVVLGLSNLTSFIKRYADSTEHSTTTSASSAENGFGSRKFGA